MNRFLFENADIKGVSIISSFVQEDNRGEFIKKYEKQIFADNNIVFNCNESFVTVSSKYVVRGMHFQLFHPQKKLVSVLSGKVYDVVVDLRKESDTFGKWIGVYLTERNRMSILIPEGCAHGFISLSDNSIVSYECDGKYDSSTDTGIIFDDPNINIEWPINDMSNVILSNKDRKLMTFNEFKNQCEFEYR